MSNTVDLSADLDILRTVPEIAKFINTNPRRTQYLIDSKMLPTFHEGRIVCARKSRLVEHYAQLENQ